MTPPEVSDATVSMLLALLSPEAADLYDDTVWQALPSDLFPHQPWIDRLASSVEGLVFLTDASRSPVAERLLAKNVKEPADNLSTEEPPPHRAWTPLVEVLAQRDGSAVAEVLARMFRAAVEESLAHRDDPPEEPDPIPRWSDPERAWQVRIARLVSGVGGALACPAVRRREREVRAALRAELPRWSHVAQDLGTPVGPWAGRAVHEHSGVRDPLANILRVAMTEAERIAALGAPGGVLHPFWRSLLVAGVPTPHAVTLLDDVAQGRVVAVAGRGAPSAREMEEHDRLRFDSPRPSAEEWIREAIIESRAPGDLPQVPGFPAPDAHRSPPPELVERYTGFFDDWTNVRAYLWAFVRDLDDDSVIWTLLTGREPYQTRYETVRGVGRQGTHKRAAELDGAGLTRAIALPGVVGLTGTRWDLIANAGLLACLDGAALLPLLAAPAACDARPTLLVEVLRSVLAADRVLASRWLLGRLHDHPAAVDRECFADVWVESGVENEALLAYLDAAPTGAPRGEGVVRALVRRGVERFALWLENDANRDAALAALTLLPDWKERLGAALRESERVPAPSVLAHLLRRDSAEGLEVLDLAAASWSPALRRELWRSAVAADPLGRNRNQLWGRLAMLG